MPFPLFWLFLVGLSWSFHVTFTLQSLMTTQPDVQEYGVLFSWTIIYLFNIAGVGLWVVSTTNADINSFISALSLHATTIYAALHKMIVFRAQALYQAALPWLKKLIVQPAP